MTTRLPGRRWVLAIVTAILLAAAGCSSRGQSAGSNTSVHLTVYAAASLRDALAEVERMWTGLEPEVSLTVATGSSAALRSQIELGAPADVFLSADGTNPRALVDAGLADGDAVAFATNRLTIIVPEDNPAGIMSPADLARPGVRIVAAGEAVPVTRYAREVVDRLASLPGYPPGFAAACAANVATEEDDVKAVVAKISLGEGDAGIVYATDAAAAPEVARVEIPEDANVRATYAGIVLRASSHGIDAHAFLDWLAGVEGQSVLGSFGFLPPP